MQYMMVYTLYYTHAHTHTYMRCHCRSEIVILRILTVLVKIKTNKQQIQELLFRLSNIIHNANL